MEAAGDASRVLVVSDTHLSPRTPEAGSNWAAVVRQAQRQDPELTVHAGDLTLDGIRSAEELAGARDRLDELPGQWAAVPGNHDIGDTPGPPLLDLNRLEAGRAHIGPDRWSLQVGTWTLLGLNAHLFESNLEQEKEQCQRRAQAGRDAVAGARPRGNLPGATARAAGTGAAVHRGGLRRPLRGLTSRSDRLTGEGSGGRVWSRSSRA